MSEPNEQILLRVYKDLNSYLFNLESENIQLRARIGRNDKMIEQVDELLGNIYDELEKIAEEKNLDITIPVPKSRLNI